MDPSLKALVILGVIGILLIGSIVLNSLTPSTKNERVMFSERCTIRYSVFGLLRMGAMTPGFFAISDRYITVKLIFANRYKISNIRSSRISSGEFGRHVAIRLWYSIATIHIYSKRPEELLKQLDQIRSQVI